MSFVYTDKVATSIMMQDLREKISEKRKKEQKEKEKKEKKEKKEEEAVKEFIRLVRMPTVHNIKCYDPKTGEITPLDLKSIDDADDWDD
jgi:glucose dehydrogenase